MKCLDLVPVEAAREAYRRGMARSRGARRRKGKHLYGWNPDPRRQAEIDATSAVAEFFVSVVTGRRWLSNGLEPDDPSEGDIEGGLEVRHTDRLDGCLIIHPKDSDEHPFVLVVGEVRQMRIVGYLPGREGKKKRYWRVRGVRCPAYFVPQQVLRPIGDLILRGGDDAE
jgi:hypothetical protein